MASDAEIESWFSSDNNNIGIVCGPVSNLLVIDIDPRNGGDQSAVQLGLRKEAADVITGSGSYHFYYWYPTWLYNHRIVLPEGYTGIDIQGKGKYVLAPPSIHPRTGREYIWQRDFRKQVDLPMPDLLYDYKENCNRIEKTPVRRSPFRRSTQLLPVKTGERNSTAASIAGTLISKGLNYDRTWNILTLWNSSCDPPLCDMELRRTLDSIWILHYGSNTKNRTSV
jgi:hypothetical protein